MYSKLLRESGDNIISAIMSIYGKHPGTEYLRNEKLIKYIELVTKKFDKDGQKQ